MDTFTHHFCANGHGGTIGTGFPYIRRVDRRTLAPVQYIVLSSLLRWQSLLYSLQPSSQPFYKVSIRPSLLRITLRNRNDEWDDGGTWFLCFEGCPLQHVSTRIHVRDRSVPVLTTTSHQCASHYTHSIYAGDWCSGALEQTPGHTLLQPWHTDLCTPSCMHRKVLPY